MKSVVIMQPYIFPYIGYFQLIKAGDVFVSYDDIQYMRGGWINRNRILSNGKPQYITFPVKKISLQSKINERCFADNISKIKRKVLSTLRQNYSKAPFFPSVFALLENIINTNENNVARFAEHSLKMILDFLTVNVHIKRSSELNINQTLSGKDRVIAIVKQLEGELYVNPIGGLDLYSPQEFAANGIALRFLKCKAEPYRQFSDAFVPNLSIIDILMFNSLEDMKKRLSQYELIESSAR